MLPLGESGVLSLALEEDDVADPLDEVVAGGSERMVASLM